MRKEEQQERLAMLGAGFGVRLGGIQYRAMTRALADELPQIRAAIRRLNVQLVIVDSFAPACGAEPETADAAIRLFNALRSLEGVTRWVLAHMSKAATDRQAGGARPFGSVFVQNLARSVWELRRSPDAPEDELVMGLYHNKTNRGRRHEPFGLRFSFAVDGEIRVSSADISEQPELAQGLSLPTRLVSALAGGARTAKDLAAALREREDTVSRTLRRLAGGRLPKVVRLESEKGEPVRWGLAHR